MWPFHRRDRLIDTLIKVPVYRFTEHDERLAQKTLERRAIADRKRREAAQIDTKDDQPSKLYRVRA